MLQRIADDEGDVRSRKKSIQTQGLEVGADGEVEPVGSGCRFAFYEPLDAAVVVGLPFIDAHILRPFEAIEDDVNAGRGAAAAGVEDVG